MSIRQRCSPAFAAAAIACLAAMVVVPAAAHAEPAPTAAQCLSGLPESIMAVTDAQVVAAFDCADQLDQSVYTVSSWNKFVTDHRGPALDAYRNQGLTISAGLLLQLGFNILELRGDPTSLASLVAALPTDPAGFDPEAWAHYAQQLALAKFIVRDPSDATQAYIDQVTGWLASAANDLGIPIQVPDGGTPDPGGSSGPSGQPQPTVTVTRWATPPPQPPTSPPSDGAGPTPTPSGGDLVPQTGPAQSPRVKVGQTKLVLKRGSSLTIPAAAYKADGKAAKVSFKSSKRSIATVTAKGKIRAKKPGRTTITVTSPGAAKVKISVRVLARSARSVAVTRANASGVPKTMRVGQVAYAAGKYAPAGAVKAKVTYRSSKAGVVTANKTGRLLAKAPGRAVITVKAGAKSKKYPITVTP
ncbi:MAG: Ig-like domain-containing protein [Bifidobacteriaceae bacterium]|jgi:hypothetical protein|nr:Ig-like domain-containing protein [Bifidobacteriaceae bacterium]